jgi:hypothetical protein
LARRDEALLVRGQAPVDRFELDGRAVVGLHGAVELHVDRVDLGEHALRLGALGGDLSRLGRRDSDHREGGGQHGDEGQAGTHGVGFSRGRRRGA